MGVCESEDKCLGGRCVVGGSVGRAVGGNVVRVTACRNRVGMTPVSVERRDCACCVSGHVEGGVSPEEIG